MVANVILVFFYYAIAAIIPFLLFSCLSSACRDKGGPTRSLTIMLCQYISKFPLIICLYHLLLTIGLAAFCVQEVQENMSVAVDLNYYTKTSIRATEAYDAIQDGKFQKSFNTWYFQDQDRRLEEEKLKDLVAVYHSSDSWDNVLTSDYLIDFCLAEKLFLKSQSCIGSEVSSILESVMTENCTFRRSFEESLLVFGLEENALYVEDSVNNLNPESSVVLSYYKTSCSLKLKSVEDSVTDIERVFGSTTQLTYAHTDLVTDAFVASGINDVRLSLIAMIVCYGVLSLSVGLKFMFGMLFMLCIVLSLTVAAGTLPLFGFAYFSAFNVLAIFVITGVGADAIIVFCSSWYKSFAAVRTEASSYSQSLSNESQDLLDKVDMLPLLPLVLYNAYTPVVTALTFTVLTTILSFLANLVSPIVVIAQLGAFMGTAMAVYFTLLHLVLIPAWIFVIKIDQYVSLCRHCLEFFSWCTLCCTQVTPSTTPGTVTATDQQSEGWGGGEEEEEDPRTHTHMSNEIMRVEDVNASETSAVMLGTGGVDGTHLESFRDDDSMEHSNTNSNGNYVSVSVSNSNASNISSSEIVVRPMNVEVDGSDEDFAMSDIYAESEFYVSKPVAVKRKQSLWLGCSVLLCVITAMFVVIYGITEVLDTDFGLPTLFKEGTNMADLLYITKNYKSDMLTLGNSGGSSSTPDPGTVIPSSIPSLAPTHFPTILTMTPTATPTTIPSITPTTVPTTIPSAMPTSVPTTIPTLTPTETPTTVPTSLPTTLPTATPSHLPTGVPSQAPVMSTLSPTSPSSAPSRKPTLQPSFSVVPSLAPSYSVCPTSVPSSVSPTSVPSSVSPTSSPSSSTPTLFPSTFNPSSSPSGVPTSSPSSSPSGLPSSEPTGSPSSVPSSAPTFLPSSSPSLTPSSATPTISQTSFTLSPSSVSELAATGNTFYTVYICYGIDIQQEKVDTEPTAKVNHESFGRYTEEGGLLSDLEILCDYLAANKIYLEVSSLTEDCIYNQLMAVEDDSDRDIDIFERIGLWMAQEKERTYQVGVQETESGAVVSGNFGEELNLWLTWICQPISCRSEVSSFFNDPEHALTMIDRWDHALYDVGSEAAEVMDVIPLTASDAWLFPLLSSRIVSSIYVSSSISFIGCLILICFATRNLKLSLLIGIGMLFVMITSLLLHAMIFSSVIDLIDIIVVISFVGIIIDYPTHLAFHYEKDLKLRKFLAKSGVLHIDGHGGISAQQEEDNFHRHSFSYMRLALIGPAVTTICSALPLLFAEFSILSKAGEYVVIMCVCTYLYVAFVMPTLLRLVGEFIFVPCRYNSQDS